jgi:hypothetical protein
MAKSTETRLRLLTKRYNNRASRRAHHPTNGKLNFSSCYNSCYKVVNLFFENTIDKRSFLGVFGKFIETPDFTEFLKKVPDLPGLPMSKEKMNDLLLLYTLKMRKMMTTKPKGLRSTTLRYNNRVAGGSSRELLPNDRLNVHGENENKLAMVVFIQCCFSIFILLRIPRRIAPFFCALVLFIMINFIEFYLGIVPGYDDIPSISDDLNFQSRAVQNIVYSQALVVPIHISYIIKTVFGWINLLMNGAPSVPIEIAQPQLPLLEDSHHPVVQTSSAVKTKTKQVVSPRRPWEE